MLVYSPAAEDSKGYACYAHLNCDFLELIGFGVDLEIGLKSGVGTTARRIVSRVLEFISLVVFSFSRTSGI